MIIGPPLVGLIVDAFGYPGALRYAIPIVTLGIAPIAPIAIVLLLRLRSS